MDQHTLITILLFLGFFFGLTSLLQTFSKKTSFPYTVALLVVGFIAQFVVHFLHLDLHLNLSPDLIYFVLLPILLFEAAMHINFHQFRLQFKTITFLATFGLLISIFTIGYILATFAGLPMGIALLFGAIISATDPIAVLALFKTLGAPKRLSLLADGESMFNDATGVIAFKLVSTFVVANSVFSTNKLFVSLYDFSYVFIGSMLFGSLFGYVGARVIEKVKDDRLVVTALTCAVGFASFVGAEHFFHFSGVISTVMAGIMLGNLGRTKITAHVNHSVEQFWEYLGFVSLSLVFFFASFNLELSIFARDAKILVIAVSAVLVGRALSVYLTAFLSNRLPFFKDEPNIPLSWQHILNWGGLRGVIPLVLAYSLPDTFAYKEDILAMTLAALLFTLIINGLTIKSLLVNLKLHLPKKEERILADAQNIFDIEHTKEQLAHLEKGEFNPRVIDEVRKGFEEKEQKLRSHLLKNASPEELEQALFLEAINIERATIGELFHAGHINENVYYDFDTELDLQQDALEYPEVFTTRAVEEGGTVKSKQSYRARLKRMRSLATKLPLLSVLFEKSDDEIVADRYGVLRARLVSSERVLAYLERINNLFNSKAVKNVVDRVSRVHKIHIVNNKEEIETMEEQHTRIIRKVHTQMLAATLEGDSQH